MKKVLFILAMLIFIVACSEKTKETLGISKQIPDENTIVTNRPLTLPPDFDTTPVNSSNNY